MTVTTFSRWVMISPDLDVAQVQDPAQHLALLPDLLAAAGVQVDRPAQLLLALVRADRR
ncbi:MAG: hypothetical protein U5L06_11725 [Rhodovibrio sp.]|nr:hypothetical protein [Rhodovibrio sp.]